MPGPEDTGPTSRRRDPSDEDLDFEVAFYEQILQRLPDYTDVLMALGNNYTQRGDFEKGLAIDERLCQLRAGDPIVRYNLACSYSLLGRVDEALQALEQAAEFGYRDVAYIQRDPDLENVRTDPRYAALLERLLRKQLTS
ncbi:MAG: TPR end-of-group domain-containing protein [Candidatus Brocadiia bacterium]